MLVQSAARPATDRDDENRLPEPAAASSGAVLQLGHST
jgi:hypothetical protein